MNEHGSSNTNGDGSGKPCAVVARLVVVTLVLAVTVGPVLGAAACWMLLSFFEALGEAFGELGTSIQNTVDATAEGWRDLAAGRVPSLTGAVLLIFCAFAILWPAWQYWPC